MPGTEIYVTPDIAAPTMAIAATPRGVLRPPVKNVAELLPRDVSHATPKSRARYEAMVMTIAPKPIAYRLFALQ